jgi:hypothetical protein
MSNYIKVNLFELTVFFLCWYIFFCITYGTNVPAGLFLPGMILGCCIGNIASNVVLNNKLIDESEFITANKNFVVLGTAAMLAGYTRMTYSLAVIMMETAQVINLFIPIVFTVLIANATGSLFTRSLYDRAVRGKQIPILIDSIPEPCKNIMAELMMNKDLVILQRVDTLENIAKAMSFTHHAFPVVNAAGNLIGMIPRNFIITLIKQKGYYVHPHQEN